MTQDYGKVFLVGAGPGDPGLLTLRGAELLRRADVVVYDRLVPAELLSMVPATARRVYVGKTPGQSGISQDEINAILVREARSAATVVRLKGGDPLVFGRGGEEALALRWAGIPFEIVPGVTAGVAGPAYAGIPVTHRGLTSSVVFVTGNEDPAKPDSDLDYAALARIGTVVFYMGVGHLRENLAQLVTAGRSPQTPAAIVQWATTARQRTVTGTLATLADRAEAAGMAAPCIVIVGEVAALRDELAWCERLPLFGRTILVTRSRRQASELVVALRDLGARVIELPTIEIRPVDSPELTDVAGRLAEFDWIVFTSPNGVIEFAAHLSRHGKDVRALAPLRIAAIGPGTARHLADVGLRADLVSEKAIAESLADALLAAGVGQGTSVLLTRAEEARDVLPDRLRAAGAVVTDVAVYRTVVPEHVDAESLAALAAGDVDLVTLTSSSTARHLAEVVRAHGGDAMLDRVCSASRFFAIGPITARTADEFGFQVIVESPVHTIDGLVEAIRRWAAENPGFPANSGDR
ncbi:MAG: uroporphyrinogen-III C-methyltransferase [Planctomycetes bacterium]|nr:uroporphyrinogen-III C-methyltransferase [Planctomycetota bacterium]